MKKLLIFDISNFIFRAFYAIRPLNAPDGTPVNAVYGVAKMVLNAIDDLGPTHVLIAQDNKGGSFRNELYTEYKANRSEPPDELKPQFAIIDEMLKKFQLPCVRVKNYEADDVIGSSVTQFYKDFDQILIASSDKDLMQFVDDKVNMIDTMKSKIYKRDGVFEKMGVYPEQIVDYLSLVGDASDNIPGVKGIGAKGASKLLAEYTTLEKVFENIESISNKRVLNGLTNHKEEALLSKELITIKTQIPLGVKQTQLEYKMDANQEIKGFLEKYNFKSLINQLFIPSSKKPKKKDEKKTKDFSLTQEQKQELNPLPENDIYFIEAQVQSFLKHNKSDFICLRIHEDKVFVSTEKIRFCYKTQDKASLKEVVSTLVSKKKNILTLDPKILTHFCLKNNLVIKANIIDFSILHFAAYPYKKHDALSVITHLSQQEVGKEMKKSDYRFLSLQKLMLNGLDSLKKEVKDLGLEKIVYDIDTPLNPILVKMEENGITLEGKTLNKLSKEYHKELKNIQAQIFEESNFECNLKSPKQVAELLFDKLGLPIIKKNKTGPSTDASVLKVLAQLETSPVPELIIRYREIDKLLSTYIDALPKLIDEKTQRIHTNFNQTGAATGRLSSENPNLQNIPVKSQYGRNIRKAFIAPKDHYLLSADYSQIELRILAHMSQDPTMLNAFKHDLDIHTQTASEVFNVSISDMDDETRSKAKAINFGLIYGQSSFGLSESLGIDRTEASEYIKHYFQKFSHIKSFLDSLKEKCVETGYAETIVGRKRIIPEILATNRNVKSFGERIAVNSPIQGSAADILKLAMIKLDKKISTKKLKSKMLLQVHDELIFEVPENELELMQELVNTEMSSAFALDVPLKVDISYGKTWYEL